MTSQELQRLLETHGTGRLLYGTHPPNHRMCALEFDAVVRGRAWSDKPVTLPDLRPLNDGFGGDDAARTEALLPVMAALWNWSEWTAARRVVWARHVALETVRQIMAELPGLPDRIRAKCRNAHTMAAAVEAAEAAVAVTWATAGLAVGAARAEAAAGARAAAEAALAAAKAAAAWEPEAALTAGKVAWAARAAAEAVAKAGARAAAAARAAEAAAAAKGWPVLQLACQIWITAAEETHS